MATQKYSLNFVPDGASANKGARRFTRTGLGLTLQLSGLTTLQILISFIVQWIVIARVGVSGQADALYAGSTIPQVVALLTLSPLASVVVPFLAAKREPELSRNTWDLFVWVLIVFTAIALLLSLAVPVLMPLLVPGFKGAQRLLVIRLAYVQVLGIAGSAVYTYLASVYQVHNKFLWPAFSTLLCAALGLGVLVWKLPIYGIVLANYVQVFVNTAPGLLLLRILGRPHGVRLNVEPMKQLARQMRPLVIGSAFFRWGMLLDRWLASFLAPGSLVLLDLAQRTYGAAGRILNQGIVTPMMPQLSRLAFQDDWEAFCKLRLAKLKEMVLLTVLMTLPMLLLWAFSARLLVLLPGHFAHVNPESVQKMAVVFSLMSGMLLFPNQCLSAAYYAQGDTTTPTKIWSVSFVIGSAAKIIGFFVAGLMGIALAVSFYNLLTCVLLWYYWRPGLAGVVAEERFASIQKASFATPAIAARSDDIPA